jgi:TRAP-type C4-dicarboxylate transport system permease small subunit
MLYASVLLTQGSWKQMVLNSDTTAPASGLSVGIFYAAGVVFGVAACLILASELYLLLAGRLGNAELIAISESEDLAQPAASEARHP